MKKIAIDICCNDPENGNFAYRAAGITVGNGEIAIELMARDMIGPRMRVNPEAIIVSNKRWPIVASKDWLGNWCWNRYWMRHEDAVAFLLWVHEGGKFQCDMAWGDIFDAWKLRNGNLKAVLERELIEATA